jgi:Ni,Fe-hydrogenase I cytochrome b subunit
MVEISIQPTVLRQRRRGWAWIHLLSPRRRFATLLYSSGNYANSVPHAGGALQPYVLVVAQIFLHFPTCVVRVARWKKIQVFSLVLAGVNIAITIQAYVSTRLQPEQVLVWTPVTLILDAGAMLQIYVVIIEGISFRVFTRTLVRGVGKPFKAVYARVQALLKRGNKDVETNSPGQCYYVLLKHV